MRQIFSVRFFAAVGGVVGLYFLLTAIFVTQEVIEGDGDDEVVLATHGIDFVEQVFASDNDGFEFDDDGLADGDVTFIIDGSRSLRVVAGTPGEQHCPDFGDVGACAVVADLLGEAVVWFALVPMGPSRTVDMPAIDILEDGQAHLVNGWQVPYAPILDRRCSDLEFESYSEFREILGDDFTSIFDIDDRRLGAVECQTRVDYAPPATTSTTIATTTTTTIPLDATTLP